MVVSSDRRGQRRTRRGETYTSSLLLLLLLLLPDRLSRSGRGESRLMMMAVRGGSQSGRRPRRPAPTRPSTVSLSDSAERSPPSSKATIGIQLARREHIASTRGWASSPTSCPRATRCLSSGSRSRTSPTSRSSPARSAPSGASARRRPASSPVASPAAAMADRLRVVGERARARAARQREEVRPSHPRSPARGGVRRARTRQPIPPFTVLLT
jgi:hypothetical protein